MANRIVSVHAGIYGIGIYAIMLPSSGFSVAPLPSRCIRGDLSPFQYVGDLLWLPVCPLGRFIISDSDMYIINFLQWWGFF